ncbi:MAG: hypothetical protein COV66_00535 [Nitrospinae bacterium CG11_big_fil_rev_8_21_14_0_20_45_15]|nr:MAG: hypothetical protein COV66_00535 [Nitrospinae bacterium CG11_big_fil_rev_8_21_14_0_20_45_15]
METIHAPLLNAGNLDWLNVKKPLDLPDLTGKLTILDFWTFCCINCIHIIPTLKRLEERFPTQLAVIGVHSPKFSGEREFENLRQAVARYEIVHPIVHDPDFTIWKSYAIRAWPTLVFIDPNGYILGQLPGEPDPEMLEHTLTELIADLEKKDALHGDARELLQVSAMDEAGLLHFPGKITFSESDLEFAIADSNHNQIVTANREGRVTRRIGSGAIGSKDGSFDSAEFYRPQGLCYVDGVIWVADTENHLLRKIDLKTETVTTEAGTGKQGVPLKGQEKSLETALSSPWDVSMDDGWIYFANAGTHQIGVFYPKENAVAQFAGTGAEALVDGLRLAGAFAQPSGLTVGEGKLFLADSETSAIRSIRLDDAGFIATYVGTGLFDFGDSDGVGKEAVLQHALGVHYSDGKVYIADSYNHKIKVLDVKTLEVSSLKASVDIVCNDHSCTRLGEPAGVVKVGNCLYVSDTNHHRILKMDLTTSMTEIFIQ